MARHALSPSIVREMRLMRDAGVPRNEIAAHVGIHRNTVTAYMRPENPVASKRFCSGCTERLCDERHRRPYQSDSVGLRHCIARRLAAHQRRNRIKQAMGVLEVNDDHE